MLKTRFKGRYHDRITTEAVWLLNSRLSSHGRTTIVSSTAEAPLFNFTRNNCATLMAQTCHSFTPEQKGMAA